MNKTEDLLSCLKLESTEWMLSPRIFKQILYVYRMPALDMFASTLSHQVPKYFSWILDPQAVRVDVFSVNWNKGLLYMFPPFSLIQKLSSENNRIQGSCSFNNTSMAVKTIVSYATKSPVQQTSSITTQSINIETAMVSNSTSFISEQEDSSSCLAFVRRSFKDQKFSARVCKITGFMEIWHRETVSECLETIL